ncbi:Tat pathway signal protein [Kineobactrum sediminis]|uniref:Tat pathway signal protein n=1 Tax=Kineobactrum sediminis TaxID=1905677 RepID=A0A2N5Y181_9GAMM|nr:gluconate 2-dehydrogenase subunit 3 family protein [Kineobactrum sediminis]PLW82148.1 Tat pathway signal protein [Kineobactrum sediminis]
MHPLRGRRSVVKALVLAYPLVSGALLLSPAQARERKLPLAVLDVEEAADLEAVIEALVPGSAEAGAVHFIDYQLARPAIDSLLMLRYLGVPQPHVNFYRSGLAALAQHAIARYGKRPSQLPAPVLDQLITDLITDDTPDWAGPPASFLYFVWRSDGVDVTYGTEDGMAALDTPYMAHIRPEKLW